MTATTPTRHFRLQLGCSRRISTIWHTPPPSRVDGCQYLCLLAPPPSCDDGCQHLRWHAPPPSRDDGCQYICLLAPRPSCGARCQYLCLLAPTPSRDEGCQYFRLLAPPPSCDDQGEGPPARSPRQGPSPTAVAMAMTLTRALTTQQSTKSAVPTVSLRFRNAYPMLTQC